MIEVEIKIPLMNGNEDRLLNQAEFIEELVIRYIYLDDRNYSLTLADKWLRQRNGQFELKIPANPADKNTHYEAHRYEELTQDQEIMSQLNINDNEGLRTALLKNEFNPFASFTTTRRSYKDGKFTIDIDQTDFGYAIGEIELLVNHPSKTQAAEKELHNHLSNLGVSYSLGHIGKVAHYLQRYNPVHFCQLVDAEVISADKNRKFCESLLPA